MKSSTPRTGDKSPTAIHKAATTAHLLETTAHQLAHSKRHLDSLGKKGNTPKGKALDYEHLQTHLKGGIEHVQKLMGHIQSNYPSEGKELGKLQDTVARSDIGQRVKAAHGKVK